MKFKYENRTENRLLRQAFKAICHFARITLPLPSLSLKGLLEMVQGIHESLKARNQNRIT